MSHKKKIRNYYKNFLINYSILSKPNNIIHVYFEKSTNHTIAIRFLEFTHLSGHLYPKVNFIAVLKKKWNDEIGH